MEATKAKHQHHAHRKVATPTIDVVAAPKSSEPETATLVTEPAAVQPSFIKPVAIKSQKRIGTTFPWSIIVTAIFFFVALSSLTVYAYLKSK